MSLTAETETETRLLSESGVILRGNHKESLKKNQASVSHSGMYLYDKLNFKFKSSNLNSPMWYQIIQFSPIYSQPISNSNRFELDTW